MYLQPIENGRAAHLEFNLFYNPEDPQECVRIKKLHAAASERMHALGAVFTRAYGSWAEMVNYAQRRTVPGGKNDQGDP